MAREITQFAADDGSLFDTAEAADAHSRAVSIDNSVTEFSGLAGLDKAQTALMKKLVPAYLDFAEKGVTPEKLVKKERKARVPKPAVALGAAPDTDKAVKVPKAPKA